MSYADKVFKETIANILENGVSDEGMEVRPRWPDGTPAHTVAVFGVTNRYDLSKEFPIMTLRRTFWKSAWHEISWIWQQKSNNIHNLKSNVWDEWADESGSIGKAYGYQMGKKNGYRDIDEKKALSIFGMDSIPVFFYDGEACSDFIRKDDSLQSAHVVKNSFDGRCWIDQTDRVIYDLNATPASRRILTNMYCMEDLSEMALHPCAYSMTFTVTGDRLNAILSQRSQDMLAANNWNVVQASLLVYAFASAYGFKPGELLHTIANCHAYTRHIDTLKRLCEQPEHGAPKFWIDPEVKDFYDFSADSFRLENYVYNPFDEKIEIAI